MNKKDDKRYIKIVNDSFAQCQNPLCGRWLRLLPVDPTEMRTIPLVSVIHKDLGEIFVCDECYEEQDRYDSNNI